MRRSLPVAALAIVLLGAPSAAPAQGGGRPDSTAAPRVFLDCPDYLCDFDFVRTELPLVDWVRDRKDADVHVLVTSQGTGAGGQEYTLTFIGQKRLAATQDTLRYDAAPAESDDARRQGIARTLKLGLVPVLAHSALASRVQVSFATPKVQATPAGSAPRHDPWNYWVFSARVSAYLNGEASSKFLTAFGSLSASRTTAAWKTTVSFNGSRAESSFDVGDRTIRDLQRTASLGALAVRAVDDHWSVGARGSSGSSTFLNQRFSLRLSPAVEFDVFPYAQSTRRQLRFLYAVGPTVYDYREQTIFRRDSEVLLTQELTAALDLRQRWGSTGLQLLASQYVNRGAQYHLDANGNASLRLVKGLSLTLFGQAQWLRDQIYLPAGAATEEQILLRQRQLKTNYRYYASVGVSYSFGSIFNNVVNPRFGGEGGGFIGQ